MLDISNQYYSLILLLVGEVSLIWISLQLSSFKENFSTALGRRIFQLNRSITGIAAFFYFAMIVALVFSNFDSNTINNFRHLDWLLTTPIIMFVLGFIANQGKIHWSIPILVAFDIVVMLTGVLMPFTTPILASFLFVFGNIVFGLMIVILLAWYARNTYGKTVEDQQPSQRLYRRLMFIIIFVWSMYPVVEGLSGTTTAFFDIEAQVALYMILDVFSKGIFVFLVSQDTLTAEELGFKEPSKSQSLL